MANPAKGHTLWFIPDGYIPPQSSGSLTSHESICVLNCGDEEARLHITVYFEDRPPLEKMEVSVSGRRTYHIRTSTLEKDGQHIPVGVPYAMEVESDIPVIVQYSRMDTTQAENTLMSVMGYPAG